MVLKNAPLFNFVVLAIFCDFWRFWLDLGSPRALQKFKKIEKIDFLTRLFLKEGSGRVLGRFWEDFGKILKGI